MLYILIVGIIFIFVLKIRRYLKNKKIIKIGAIGENNASLLLSQLNKKKYHIVNNIILKHKNNKTTQIDHVVISRKGIFVIETKNYSGLLLGNLNERYWTHISGKNKHIVYNISYQNEGHIKAIKNCVDNLLIKALTKRKYKKFFVSILLFKDSCNIKLKKSFFKRKNFKICKFFNLIKNIKKGHKRNLISKKLYHKLILAIEESNISTKKNLKTHIKQLKR